MNSSWALGINEETSILRKADALSYTLRRFYVDMFHFRWVPKLKSGSLVLDLGGNRIRKRGYFDIEKFPLSVIYANLSCEKLPHIQTDAAHLPFNDETFDIIICSELLEHVPAPVMVLHEAYRVLKPGGQFLACIPFLVPIHGDPNDFGRYTDTYLMNQMAEIGFDDVALEKQGAYWSVLFDIIRDGVYQAMKRGKLRSQLLGGILKRIFQWARLKAIIWDNYLQGTKRNALSNYVSGFGVVARRR